MGSDEEEDLVEDEALDETANSEVAEPEGEDSNYESEADEEEDLAEKEEEDGDDGENREESAAEEGEEEEEEEEDNDDEAGGEEAVAGTGKGEEGGGESEEAPKKEVEEEKTEEANVDQEEAPESPIHERAKTLQKEVQYAAEEPRKPGEAVDVGAIEVTVTFDLGDARIPLRDLEGFKEGYTFTLDRPNDEFVNIRANGTTIGRGRIVDVDGRIGVQIESLKGSGQQS
ncbi:MAG: FliM/FliN family flagellar motor switch protein [Puniceicoccales bacterium]|jgi:flagellar motor switch/type III secretory pathway protein FliN|nr:FliM/FliN family flagellar motor switch protein [Puniceicoccales bacterium]